MTTTYDSLMKLRDEYQAGLDDHNCPQEQEEFTQCDVCERSIEARSQLSGRMNQIMNLLEREHQAMAELTESVIQEVGLPRPERLQKAMLRALTVLKC